LKYAIREIVLVVIGILVALSINNWNESRKEQQQEMVILNELQNEFNRNLT
jgi:type II secretory pathway pseudopilin PulG